MAQAIRQTAVVTSEGKIEIQSSQLHQGAKIEIIIILEDHLEKSSAEELAIQRLGYLDDPSQLVTVIDADQDIDEVFLQEWVEGKNEKRQIKCI
jgi:hypothetical protein